VSQWSNGYFAHNGRLQRIKARLRAQRSSARAGGTPDSLQGLSGAPPDSQAGPQDRAPTVRTLRSGDVAGAPDSVRWRTGLSGAPCDRSLHQTASLVVGVMWGTDIPQVHWKGKRPHERLKGPINRKVIPSWAWGGTISKADRRKVGSVQARTAPQR
jgi:hypothetical protein